MQSYSSYWCETAYFVTLPEALNESKIISFKKWQENTSGRATFLLALIRVGFLGVRFALLGGNITPCLKFVRIMLET